MSISDRKYCRRFYADDKSLEGCHALREKDGKQFCILFEEFLKNNHDRNVNVFLVHRTNKCKQEFPNHNSGIV